MNRVYIFVYAFIAFMAIIAIIIVYLLSNPKSIEKDKLVIKPSNVEYTRFNVTFWNNEQWKDASPEQIALFLRTGQIPRDSTWHIYPDSEYQLTIIDDELHIQSFGRTIGVVLLENTGEVGELLINDNL